MTNTQVYCYTVSLCAYLFKGNLLVVKGLQHIYAHNNQVGKLGKKCLQFQGYTI